VAAAQGKVSELDTMTANLTQQLAVQQAQLKEEEKVTSAGGNASGKSASVDLPKLQASGFTANLSAPM
jgi:hypothetical protein